MLYFDTSALAKLCSPEPETVPLGRWLQDHPGEWVTSALTRLELTRAVARADSSLLARVPIVLNRCHQLELDERILVDAGVVKPVGLRSLDAIHLATALELTADLEAVVSYDNRLREAAEANGLGVAAPS